MTITQFGLQISRTSAAKPLYDRMADDDIRAKQDDRLPDRTSHCRNVSKPNVDVYCIAQRQAPQEDTILEAYWQTESWMITQHVDGDNKERPRKAEITEE